MSIVSLCALALTSAILALAIRRHNGEISVLLIAACCVGLLISVMSSASALIEAVSRISAVSQINGGYVAILLKVIGICLLTEFTANTCRDAGSSALASNVTLAGKLMAAVSALPLYTEILNLVLSLLQR